MNSNESIVCLVCSGRYGGTAKHKGSFPAKDAEMYECDACGKYGVSGSALASIDSHLVNLSDNSKAAMSHWLRKKQGGKNRPILMVADFQAAGKWMPPSPSVVMSQSILNFGDAYLRNRSPVDRVSPGQLAEIGFYDLAEASNMLDELIEYGLLKGMRVGPSMDGPDLPMEIGLTLAGWDEYRRLKRHGKSGNYGFIAMQYSSDDIETLVKEYIKPTVRRSLGIEVKDLRDFSRAGIIDNILREQIRGCQFVLADLTHDNSGAYWEAGYAEGLGKPVIYLCEKSKFEETKTHFDTNHSTTVMWETGKEDDFLNQLVATIQRSIASEN